MYTKAQIKKMIESYELLGPLIYDYFDARYEIDDIWKKEFKRIKQ